MASTPFDVCCQSCKKNLDVSRRSQGSGAQPAAASGPVDKWYERPPLRLLSDGVGLPVLPVALPDVALFGMRVTALQYAVAAVVTLVAGVRALLFLALCCERPPQPCRFDVRSSPFADMGRWTFFIRP